MLAPSNLPKRLASTQGGCHASSAARVCFKISTPTCVLSSVRSPLMRAGVWESGCVGVGVRRTRARRLVLFGRVFLVALLQERNEILAANIGRAIEQAKPGKAIVAVLGLSRSHTHPLSFSCVYVCVLA